MWRQQQNILVAFLQLQLAEAIHLRDRSLVAHLHETVRCVKGLDDEKWVLKYLISSLNRIGFSFCYFPNRCSKLLENLKTEHKNRTSYLSYLMRCKQTLLSIVAHLNRYVSLIFLVTFHCTLACMCFWTCRLTKRVKCEQDVCKHFFASLCVRLFLQKREQQLLQFAAEFHSAKLADEKNDVLRNFLSSLETQIDEDPVWYGTFVFSLITHRVHVFPTCNLSSLGMSIKYAVNA